MEERSQRTLLQGHSIKRRLGPVSEDGVLEISVNEYDNKTILIIKEEEEGIPFDFSRSSRRDNKASSSPSARLFLLLSTPFANSVP